MDGRSDIVAYASKMCSPVEAKYGNSDEELLALIFGVTKFHSYIACSYFTVVTNHQALLYLEQAKCHHSRFACWAIELSAYDFKVICRPGTQHGNVCWEVIVPMQMVVATWV